MSQEQLERFGPRVTGAVQEIEGLVREQYPTATFELSRDADDAESILLWATVDVDDPDEVGDLVLDRLLEMQLDEGIPLHLIPIRTPERVLGDLRARPRPARRVQLSVSAQGRQAPSGTP